MSVDVVRLLELYEAHPCLWDKAHPDFKNRLKREAAEQAILPESGLASIRELRQKIKSIRCTYNQEVAKVRASVRAGLGPEEKYIPKLKWFQNADKFLRKNHEGLDLALNQSLNTVGDNSFLEYELNRGAVNDTHQEYSFNDDREESIENPIISTNHHGLNNGGTFFEQSVNHSDEPIPSGSGLSNGLNRGKRKSTAVDETVSCAVKVLHELSNRRVRNSEFAVFGDHVATQLLQLPLESAVKLQQEIQMLITKARLEALQNAASTSVPTPGTSKSPSSRKEEESDPLQIHFHVGER